MIQLRIRLLTAAEAAEHPQTLLVKNLETNNHLSPAVLEYSEGAGDWIEVPVEKT